MKLRAAAAAAKQVHPLARAQTWLRVALLENWHLKLLSLAVAFALLGYLTIHGQPGNLSAATGAEGPRVLGSITPA